VREKHQRVYRGVNAYDETYQPRAFVKDKIGFLQYFELAKTLFSKYILADKIQERLGDLNENGMLMLK
jgi:hypothetical protein